MTLADASLLFDVVLSGLLAVMIYYAVRLNKRILSLREREDEMQAMIAEFNHSSAAAHASAGALKSAGTEAEVGIKAAMAKAIALRDDLEALIQQGNATAGKLDMQATLRARADATPPPRQEPPRREEAPTRPLSGAAPRAVPEQATVRPFAPPPRPRSDVAAPETAPGPNGMQPRTEAERQLLEAIRAAKEGVA